MYAFLFTRNAVFKHSSSLVMIYLNSLLLFLLSIQWAENISVSCPLFFFIFVLSVILPSRLPRQQYSSLPLSVLNQLQTWRFLLQLRTNFCPRLLLFLNQLSTRRELQDTVPGTPDSTLCWKSNTKILPLNKKTIIFLKKWCLPLC